MIEAVRTAKETKADLKRLARIVEVMGERIASLEKRLTLIENG